MATLSRRDFLARAAGAAAAAGALPRPSLARGYSVNERVALGLIGCGDLGRNHHLRRLLGMTGFQVVACADVDQRHLEEAVRIAGGKPQGYRDYRDLLARPDVDAVLIASPDHWHALHSVHACEAGKDVYCEKPLSLTIGEGQAMVRAARRHGTVFQVGTQQRSDRRFRLACELVRSGRIGRLLQVEAVLGRGPTSAPVPDSEAPPWLDWNAWLGPAPLRPFNPKRCHYTFRWFHDYSGGKLTDWGAHHIDIAQWGIGVEDSGPVEVTGTGTFAADSVFECAVDFDVRYRYASGVTLRVVGAGENGVTFTGTRGTVFVSRTEIRSSPAELTKEPGALPVRLIESSDHHRNWLDCIRSRRQPAADVAVGHRSATVCHLGNIALRLNRVLRWDPVAERFQGDETANRLIHKPMRAPWRV
jgi:predicted dehydrogenase